MRRRVILAAVAAGSLILSACAGQAETDRPAQQTAPTEPEPTPRAVRSGDPWIPGQGEGAGDFHGALFESVDQLIHGSDLIILGAVRGSTVGEVFPDEDGGAYPTVLVHTAVAVEESLKGAAPDEITVATDELGFTAPTQKEWRARGLRVLLFLTQSRDVEEPGFYIPAGLNYAQTVYIVRGEDIELTTPGEIYRIAEQVAATSLTELREGIRDVS
jgi:hypothetical protein